MKHGLDGGSRRRQRSAQARCLKPEVRAKFGEVGKELMLGGRSAGSLDSRGAMPAPRSGVARGRGRAPARRSRTAERVDTPP